MAKEQRSEDKRLRDQHEDTTIMEEKARKLKDLITDRKKTGAKEPKKISEEDIAELKGEIKELHHDYK